jgi:hypothetical protein
MTTLTKFVGTVAAILLASGSVVDFSGLEFDSHFTVLLPFGAIFTILFMICYMLEGEVAKFDQEEVERMAAAEANLAQAPATRAGRGVKVTAGSLKVSPAK